MSRLPRNHTENRIPGGKCLTTQFREIHYGGRANGGWPNLTDRAIRCRTRWVETAVRGSQRHVSAAVFRVVFHDGQWVNADSGSAVEARVVGWAGAEISALARLIVSQCKRNRGRF